jgi:hypothetical protein
LGQFFRGNRSGQFRPAHHQARPDGQWPIRFRILFGKNSDSAVSHVGNPTSDKKHVVLEAGHDVTQRRAELVEAVLGWLDEYLGRVE